MIRPVVELLGWVLLGDGASGAGPWDPEERPYRDRGGDPGGPSENLEPLLGCSAGPRWDLA